MNKHHFLVISLPAQGHLNPTLQLAKNLANAGALATFTTTGLIVSWCSQMAVLRHRAIGCFVTHCGWNSMVESVVSGVAMVGFPQFSDQMTNAKMVEVLEIGVRGGGGDGVVEKEEIERCLEVVMGNGERGEEIRRNVVKWKGLAMEALGEGGSSCQNFKEFLQTL